MVTLTSRNLLIGIVMVFTGLLNACSSHTEQAQPLLQTLDTKQLVVVVSDNWEATTATLQKFEWRDGTWQSVDQAYPVNLGRKGLAWGIGLHPEQDGDYKVEGDGKATAGIFNLSSTFGYLPSAQTKMPYQAMSGNHYCMDVNASPLYNQIVDEADVGKDAVAGSTEPMRRDIHKEGQTIYKKGIVLDHNPENINTKGSCIFLHLWFGPDVPTAGCTSMEEPQMDKLLAWLDPTQNPRYLALPKDEYQKKQQDWGLPSL
ncbi:L,D-transpeptidase family protein [Paraglaciecola sp. 2405UD69-4]|uniref:L,D-transpeptidase family protein n=1 Tax=Paraglaciecola sp. 2405UD69-4 TaxID=3391836 RepID=UPI0039C93435